MAWKSLKTLLYGPCRETGRLHEEPIERPIRETGRITQVRRITIRLDSATRGGEREIHLHTNLPANVTAKKIAGLYRKRWTLEQAFNELTTHLRCELNTQGYPNAALFSFCVAVCCYNVLAVLKGRAAGRREATVEKEVSNFYLTNEIHSVYGGMMVMLPPEEWTQFQTLIFTQLTKQLLCWIQARSI